MSSVTASHSSTARKSSTSKQMSAASGSTGTAMSDTHSADENTQNKANSSNWMRGAIKPASWKKMTEDERQFWYDVTFEVEAMHNDRRTSCPLVHRPSWWQKRRIRRNRVKWEKTQARYDQIPHEQKSEKSSASDTEDEPEVLPAVVTNTYDKPKPIAANDVPKESRFKKLTRFEIQQPSALADEPTESSGQSLSDKLEKTGGSDHKKKTTGAGSKSKSKDKVSYSAKHDPSTTTGKKN